MKTRNKVAGGVVVGAVLLGMWLGNLFRGFGLGGSGSGDDGVIPSSVRVDRSSPPSASVAEESPDVEAAPELPLTIVIHADRYRLASDRAPLVGSDLTLDEIKARVEAADADARGIRVRILKQKNAQEGARADLYAALAEIGVKREDIQERAELID